MIGAPEVLILDEPTSGLDPGARRRLWGLLRALARERAVVASTHIPEEAEEHADTVYIFHRGRVAASGRPGDLIARHAPLSRIVVRGALPRVPGEVDGARLLASSGEEASYAARDPDRVLPRLVEALLSAGARLQSVEVRRPGLAEVFLTLTGESPYGPAGGGG